ncbi:hypothetical protein Tco_1359112, partial [Tanacetum coccineum]
MPRGTTQVVTYGILIIICAAAESGTRKQVRYEVAVPGGGSMFKIRSNNDQSLAIMEAVG